ncbi:MAG: hypothetical protein AM1032_000320 [Mycoplasmataceae bacterium]|nr:MAG: hypothetical protein AM1032_000320 [Mycoplasmataceae bacterium]
MLNKQYLKEFPKQGEIWLLNFNSSIGKEIIKIRPALIISNNLQNEFDSQIMVAIITSEEIIMKSSVGVLIKKSELSFLDRDSKILPNRIQTIFKTSERFIKKLGFLEKKDWLRFKKFHLAIINGIYED